jgi:hypothetical protein
MQKQRINALIDFEVYIYHKEKGTNLSQKCNEYLKALMLHDNSISKSMSEIEKTIERQKKELLKSMTDLEIIKQQEAEQEKFIVKSLDSAQKDYELNNLSVEENNYWEHTVNLLKTNPSLRLGRYHYYKNVFNSGLNFDDWVVRLGFFEGKTKGL